MIHRIVIYPNARINILAALFLLLSVAGCIDDYADCPEPTPIPAVGVRFTVVTRASADAHARTSRAADIAGDETGTASENYLDLAGRDIRFLLFDSDRKLLCDFTPEADIAVAEGSTDYVTYTVRASISNDYFARVATQDIDFYILIVANGRPYRLQALALVPNVTTIEQTVNQLVSFTLPIYTEHADYSRTGWLPSSPGQAGGEYIPMAGLQRFTLAEGAFAAAGPEGFVSLSPEDGSKDINMLRALAKIEVVDKIGITGHFDDAPEGRAYIEKVELLGFCATGTILPAFNQWERNGTLETQQVLAPTMTDPIVYHAPKADYQTTDYNSLIDFHEDREAQQHREDECPVFSVYITEYARTAIETAVRPYARVTVQYPDGSVLYPLRLARYNTDGSPGEDLEALLRNHIYRYEIIGADRQQSVTIQANYTVCNMNEATSGDIIFQ